MRRESTEKRGCVVAFAEVTNTCTTKQERKIIFVVSAETGCIGRMRRNVKILQREMGRE